METECMTRDCVVLLVPVFQHLLVATENAEYLLHYWPGQIGAGSSLNLVKVRVKETRRVTRRAFKEARHT